MSTVHFLNVGNGDCSIIQHGSGRVTVIDISKGQLSHQEALVEANRAFGIGPNAEKRSAAGGNFGMRYRPTNPVNYLRVLGVNEIFRFILTHPDMDHLDGFKSLCDSIGMRNFWDSRVRKIKPSFSAGPYREEDWDHYELVRDGKGGVTVVCPLADSRFDLANQGGANDRGDWLDIVAPNQQLVNDANAIGDPNDGSYVLVYRSMGGRIVFAGDSHDATWEYILREHKSLVENCEVLIAPHHGRASGREYGFLRVLRPKLTLFGCADSEHLGYSAWSNRGFRIITNNQAGNVVLDGHSAGIDIYVENLSFAETLPGYIRDVAKFGCHYIGRV
jgi:beta-lactamase superfamily II metal-dependent hydrolase